MNAHISFVGKFEDKCECLFPLESCMCLHEIKSYEKIQNVNVLFSYYVLASGDDAAQLQTAGQTWGQSLFNMLYPYGPEAASR